MYIVSREDFFMIVHGALNYDATGRKKKTVRKGTYKRLQSSGTFKPDYTPRRRTRAESIPSLNTTDCSTTVHSEAKVRQEVSKNYTVAVAYNKGAYQVIPRDSVKHIGK